MPTSSIGFNLCGVGLLTVNGTQAEAYATKNLYALCACQCFISSAEGPYIPGNSTLFILR